MSATVHAAHSFNECFAIREEYACRPPYLLPAPKLGRRSHSRGVVASKWLDLGHSQYTIGGVIRAPVEFHVQAMSPRHIGGIRISASQYACGEPSTVTDEGRSASFVSDVEMAHNEVKAPVVSVHGLIPR